MIQLIHVAAIWVGIIAAASRNTWITNDFKSQRCDVRKSKNTNQIATNKFVSTHLLRFFSEIKA